MAKLFITNSGNSVFRSITTILTGGVLLFIPGLTMKSIMIVIGAMLMFSGVVTLIVSNWKKRGLLNGLWSAQGIMNILIGLVFITSPSMMIKIFMFFVGFILVVMGFLQLAGALGSLTRSLWGWVFLIIGLLTLGSGIYLLSNPYKSAEAILPFLGGLLILNGLSDLFRGWKTGRRQSPKFNGSSVEDIPYEEV